MQCPEASSCPFASVAGEIRAGRSAGAMQRRHWPLRFWLRCAAAQSTGLRLGDLAGEYGMQAMMPQLEAVASEDTSTLRQLVYCSMRCFSGLPGPSELVIEIAERTGIRLKACRASFRGEVR